VSGVMSLSVTSILHDNPGDFNKVVIQLWTDGGFSGDSSAVCGDGSSVACSRFDDPPRTVADCETLLTGEICEDGACRLVQSAGVLVNDVTCVWQDDFTFDTARFPKDGWQQFRVRSKVDQPSTGDEMRTSTGLHVKLSNNGLPDDDVYEEPETVEGRGWYTNANYAVSGVRLDKAEVGALRSGLWAPYVEMQEGADGIEITSYRVALDAKVHAGDFGTTIIEKSNVGEFKARIDPPLDTTKLANGWHSLFVQTTQFEPISETTHSAVFVTLFQVENPPACSSSSSSSSSNVRPQPAVADFFVRGGTDYEGQNYGGPDDAELVVKASSEPKYTRHAFLRFDLSAGFASVKTATLKFNVNSLSNGNDVPLALYACSSDAWDELAVTWTTAPVCTDDEPLATIVVADVGLVEIDVSDYVANRMLLDKIVSFALLDPTQSNKAIDIDSRTHKRTPPSLDILVPSCDGDDPTPSAPPTVTPPTVTPLPTSSPSSSPSSPSPPPTAGPTAAPTVTPTSGPTPTPTVQPTRPPTLDPTRSPTRNPTLDPTRKPTRSPTLHPTRKPTRSPTPQPSVDCSDSPLLVDCAWILQDLTRCATIPGAQEACKAACQPICAP
jgi:hypothetical protein